MFVFEITSVKELALGANTEAPVDRMKWSTDGESIISLFLSLPPPPTHPNPIRILPLVYTRMYHTHYSSI